MPRAKKVDTSPDERVEEKEVETPRYQTRIPHLSFIRITQNQVLVVALVIASFFLGSLLTKVQDLQKGVGTTAPAPPVAQAQQAAPNAPTPTLGKQNVDIGHLPIMGDSNAPVTIIEFADLRCPFCKQVYDNVLPQLEADYVNTGKAKLAFRHYAFLGPASTVAANAAECANEQGKFWDFYNYMYKNQPDETDTSMFTTDKLTTIAGQLGMDTSSFSSCLSANKYNQNVSDDLAAGQKAQVSGTPTFFINGTPIVGAQPYSAFKSVIDAELAKSQ